VNNQISYAQIKFHPHSFGDPDGRLFWLEGGLYRAISSEKTSFFARLFEDGTVADLMSRGLLVGSQRTDLALDGYGMVLRHTAVPFVSYPNEWCAAMFKDAALMYLDLLKELIQRGLTLKDTHPWNLVFDGSRPVYVDMTSITTLTNHSSCPNYDKFCRYYLYPLVLMSEGQERIVRCLLLDYEGILPSDFSLLTRSTSSHVRLARTLKSGLKRRIPTRHRELLSRVAGFTRSVHARKETDIRSRLENLGRVRQEIEAVTLSSVPTQPENVDPEIERYLMPTISKLRPNSILAIGATTWYSSLAAQLPARVVVFDKDSANVTQLYFRARERNLQVLPLVMDFTDPTPSRGLSSHVSIAAADRFQCDLVLAIGLVNRLVAERHLQLDQVVDGLAQFSKRWLILDFIPLEKPQRFSGDISEDITRSLLKRFRSVNNLKAVSQNQNLLLCEK
jgi:hypothetical protein